MKALHITAHGPAGTLKPLEVPRPPLGADQVRVRIEAAAVNPSDVLSAEGRFPHAVLPRVLGRDFAGRVVEGPPALAGASVWGSGGDLGITRDGAHAEELVLPVTGVSRRPSNLSPEQAAAAGVPFTTAWTCLVDAARLTSGETVVVSGAAGAVGWAAVQLASALGARVVALVKDANEASRLDRTRVAGVARLDLGDLLPVVHEATGGTGAQVALNGVGAPVFRPCWSPSGRADASASTRRPRAGRFRSISSTSTGGGCASWGSTPPSSPWRTVHGSGPAPAAVRIRSAPPPSRARAPSPRGCCTGIRAGRRGLPEQGGSRSRSGV